MTQFLQHLWRPVQSCLLRLRVWHVLIAALVTLSLLTATVASSLVAAVDTLQLLGLNWQQSVAMVALSLWWMLVSTTFGSVCRSGATASLRYLRRACESCSRLTIGVESMADRFELAVCLLNLKLEQLL